MPEKALAARSHQQREAEGSDPVEPIGLGKATVVGPAATLSKALFLAATASYLAYANEHIVHDVRDDLIHP